MNVRDDNFVAVISLLGRFLFALMANSLSGALLGELLDSRLNSSPWGIATGAILGWSIGLCWAYRQLDNLIEDELKRSRL